MHRLICIIILGIILNSCENNSYNETLKPKITKNNIESDLKNFELSSKRDSVLYGKNIHYLSDRMVLRTDSQNIYIYDHIKFFILDSDFSTKSYFDFNDFDYLLKNRVTDFYLLKENIYFIDNSAEIKVYNTNRGDFSEISFDWLRKQNVDFYNPTSIALIDTGIILSNGINPFTIQSKHEEVMHLGFLLKERSKNFRSFSIESQYIDHEVWDVLADTPWIILADDKVIFTFNYSRFVFVFNQRAQLLSVHQLKIDSDYFVKPQLSKEIKSIKLNNIDALMVSTSGVYLELNAIQSIGNYFIYLIHHKKKSPTVVLADNEFRIIEEYESTGINTFYRYQFYATQNAFYLINPPEIFIYN